jgi:hypothetical protein
MEVTKPERDGLAKLLTEWWNHPEQELEATIGKKGGVTVTSFMDIVQRLTNKGFKKLVQEDRLNIILPNSMRFTLSGIGQIKQYCRDNTLMGRPFTAMIKDRTGVETNVELREYDTRVKARRELPMTNDDARIRPILENWEKQEKAFRLLRRWSFIGDGVRFDLSMVRSSARDQRKGSYRYVRTFQEYNFLKAPATYEVEAELIREDIKSPDDALVKLVKGVGEILRGLHRNSILIRNSLRESVLTGYKELVRSDKFRGVQPITLTYKNMESSIDPKVPNIRTGYNVTDKADGLRVHGYTTAAGELFLIDIGLNVYRTGLLIEPLKNSLLDGEWVTRDRDGNAINQFLIFDIYYDREGKNIDKMPFVDAAGQGRYAQMQAWVQKWNAEDGPSIIAKGINENNKLVVGMKTFLFGKAGDTSIFGAAQTMLAIPSPYHTDGLIFTPNSAPIPSAPGVAFQAQFKWKPAEENTIDFLINYEKMSDNLTQDKIQLRINGESGELLRYKILRLQVGASYDPAYADPRTTILNDRQLPLLQQAGAGAPAAKPDYKPVLFNPSEYPDTMANIAYGIVELDLETGDEFVMTENGERIADNSIVEMRYDPSREAGWRWIPIRVRHDKTERLHRGIFSRTLNAEKTANSVWESIHEPITLSMITTGAETPRADEISAILESRTEQVGQKYYDRRTAKSSDLMRAQGLRTFHNRWIKERILLNSTMREGGMKLLDFSCGQAGDLQKWMRLNASFVLGVDIAGEGIRDPRQGAYRRYLDTLVREGRDNVPTMVFAIADSSKPLVSGEAGATPEEADILRATFGKFPSEGVIPSYIDRMAAGALENGADVATCMFSLHYFFENKEKLDGLIKNISDTLAVGGYFVGCAFDGDKVFEMLATTKMDGVKRGMEGDAPVWSIKKRYSELELSDTEAALGMPIDVDFISIGQTHTEYLIPFKLLVRKMKTIGLELLTDEEARAIGLVQSTNMFDVSYKMATKAGQKYAMSDAMKEFSFLNRWYIFKRRSMTPVVADPGTIAAIEAAAEQAASKAEAMQLAEAGAKAVSAAAALPKSAAALKAKQNAQLQQALLSALPEEAVSASIAAAASPEVAVVKKAKKVTAAAAAAPESPEEAAASAAAAPIARISKLKAAAAEGDEEGAGAGAAAAAPVPPKTYPSAKIFTFFLGAPEITTKAEDTLLIREKDKYARSRLTTISPFMVQDTQEDGTVVEYPSVEHYMAGMRLKICGENPDKARRLFSKTGFIHEKAKQDRTIAPVQGTEQLKHQQFQGFLKEELKAIHSTLRAEKLLRPDCEAVMYDALREGMRQRMERDAPFRAIVQKAAKEGKYLLHFESSASSDMGGKRLPNGTIQGNNRVGKTIMEIAGIPY